MQLYLRSHRRRPVRLAPRWRSGDEQGEIPWNWCCGCGAEVFAPGAFLCSRCQRKEKENE